MGDVATAVFTPSTNRNEQIVLTVKDVNAPEPTLSALMTLFMVHRFDAKVIVTVSPSDATQKTLNRMKSLGVFSRVTYMDEVTMASVCQSTVADLVAKDGSELKVFMSKVSKL